MGSLGRDLTVTKFLFTTAVGAPDEWGSQESTELDTSTHRTERHTREIASASQPLSSSHPLSSFCSTFCCFLALLALSETLKGARFCFGAEEPSAPATAVLLFPVPKRRVAASKRASDQNFKILTPKSFSNAPNADQAASEYHIGDFPIFRDQVRDGFP